MTSARRFVRPAALVLSLFATQDAFSQLESLYPPPPEILAATWFYWVLPLFATIIALTIGLRIHQQRVQRTVDTWPSVDTSFTALCRPSLTATFLSFSVVMAVFAWVAFSPRSADEWILHRTVAMSSVAAGLLVCSVPWLLARMKWDR